MNKKSIAKPHTHSLTAPQNGGEKALFPPHTSSASSTPQPIVFVGLQAIAKAVGAGNLALRRWIREENFPARRCSDGIYRADPEAIRLWFRVTVK